MFNHKEESKLNSTITANSRAHTLTHDQIIKKSPYNENIKINRFYQRFITRLCRIGTMVLI